MISASVISKEKNTKTSSFSLYVFSIISLNIFNVTAVLPTPAPATNPNTCFLTQRLVKKSKQARDILKKCEKNNNFQKLLFPHPFIENSQKYDLVLLINVLPVMPVFAERLMVLQYLHEKVNNNGHVLWYAQHEGSYKKIRESKEQDLGDGIWIGTTHKHKTFFRYHTKDEISELMA